MTSQLLMLSNSVSIVRWKASEADVIPNGSLLNLFRPNGVKKPNWICQNPLAASSMSPFPHGMQSMRWKEVHVKWCLIWNNSRIIYKFTNFTLGLPLGNVFMEDDESSDKKPWNGAWCNTGVWQRFLLCPRDYGIIWENGSCFKVTL